MRHWALMVVAAAGAAMIGLSGCGAAEPDPQAAASAGTAVADAHRLVDPEEFAAVIAEPDRVTVNVHVPFDGDIPGTDLSVPFDQIEQRRAELPADRNTPLAIYCRTGPMSTTAAAALTALGYTDVVELRGGMKAWRAEGRDMLGG
ncbi:rhodanese-like domain-containing protein [Mycolicibacterium fallax]|uniref:Sulfurtransferase n=1 Tax=Mycolicibacterium fallax TaxID=1793 RepID=A0A1X1RJE5_MYCFA|nr:rhodanese-like domain-containing protein [Mycolicibacterium fallax]ORV07727.1 sulfurtransferase [Mycolicibacterium fallax]